MFIPQDIKDSIRKKNILLLAMSTINLPRDGSKVLTQNEYSFDGVIKSKEVSYSGSYYGSMEPVPMLLEEFLNNRPNKERLEEIVVLGTTETKETKEIKLSEDDELKFISADDLFKDNINEFCKKRGIESPNYRVFTYDKNNTDSVKNNISDIVEYIRGIKKTTDNEEIAFWMDDHGGFRAIQSILQSVVSILETEDIVPEEMFSGQYNSNTRKFEIKSSIHTYDMYEFVSGMHAFFDFGKSKQLEKFFRNAEGCDKELIAYVKRISEYISLCDVKSIEKEFKILGRFLKENPVNKFDKYLQIFIPNIEQDYGDLLNGKKNILRRISWCLEKGFIQQAMAFIESWIPEFIIQKKLLGYSTDSFKEMYVVYDSKKNSPVRDENGGNREISLGDAVSKAKSNKYSYNYFVDTIVRKYSRRSGTNFDCIIEWKNNKKTYCIKIEDKIDPKKRDGVCNWAVKHNELKNERNKIMHATEGRHLSYQDIVKKMKEYIELLEIISK